MRRIVAKLLRPLDREEVAPRAGADADAEREALARLIHELESLESLIERAESEADPDARVNLRYDWLRADIARVVGQHADALQRGIRGVVIRN